MPRIINMAEMEMEERGPMGHTHLPCYIVYGCGQTIHKELEDDWKAEQFPQDSVHTGWWQTPLSHKTES